MKQLLKFGCGPITYNENYICAGANKIGIINPETDEVCATLTGIKNITSLSMDKKYVYAKSTTGIYGIFDSESNSLIHKGSCRGRNDTSHDGHFFCIDDGVILDVLNLKDENMYVVKYNFYKNNYEKLYLTNHMFTCFNRIYDKTKRRAYLLCKEKTIIKKPNVYCKFFVIDVDNLSIEEELDLTFKDGFSPLKLVNPNLILISSMELQNIHTGEPSSFGFSDYDNNQKNLYILEAKILGDYLILVSCDIILVFNINQCKLINKYNCKNGVNAILIDTKLYISTWNGLFLTDTQ